MYNMKIKMKFVKLKAMGLPMYKISEELGVHRSTLTMWHQELAPYILIAKQDAMDEMLFENGHSKLDRVQMLCYQLNGLYAILDKRLEDSDENEISINRTLNQIYKITKIIHLEANEKQIERLKEIKSKRDATAVQDILEQLTNAAKNNDKNLLELSAEAARRRVTLGEISLALEKIYGRYKATIHSISGVYSAEIKMNQDFQKRFA